MAVITGKKMNIQIDGTGGTLVDLTGYANKVDLGFPTDMLDTTVFGSSSKSFIPGFDGGDDVVINFRYDPTPEAHLASIRPSNYSSSVTVQVSPEGTTTGNAKKVVEAFLKDYKLSAAPESIDEIVATFQKTGAVTHTTWA